MKKIFTLITAGALLLVSCDFLDPLPIGHYTDQNIDEYPSVIRGFLEKGYDMMPTSITANEFIYFDCATDDAVATNQLNNMRRFAVGTLSQAGDPFLGSWGRDYEGINYANIFLHDDFGRNTRYLVNEESNRRLADRLHGEAFALRAWYQWDLLKKFGGKGLNGELLGFPIITEPADLGKLDPSALVRASYDDCVKQILKDCDSAALYLPIAHRNWLIEDSNVDGSMNWHRFDGLSIKALRSLVYLTWASPQFNPGNDMTRWEKAAEYAAEVMKYKLEEDDRGNFNPTARFLWTDPNSIEIIFSSDYEKNGKIEELFYPAGFQGAGAIGPTQELVDAFPMANGYPIGHPLSGYDGDNPYAGRDPRFYATIFYNGSEVVNTGGRVNYTFETYAGGKDAAGLANNSLTNYYIKKYVYMNWNLSDTTVDTMPKSIFFLRWAQMCLVFAEAANQVGGPLDTRFGYSAKEAVSFLRRRTTNDGRPGIGASGDPYLDEVAGAGKDAFNEFVKNEWRIETCFEGQRLYHLRRWGTPAADLNKPVSKMVITRNGDDLSYSVEQVENRSFNSPYLPIPYSEVKRARGIIQNEGWETWQ